MGGAAKMVQSFFGGGPKMPKMPDPPKVPDYEGQRRAAEEEAHRRRAGLADKGMSGAILGGDIGDEGGVKKKRLLGE
jgi:hypothetical protein